jgi:hypothetical protein
LNRGVVLSAFSVVADTLREKMFKWLVLIELLYCVLHSSAFFGGISVRRNVGIVLRYRPGSSMMQPLEAGKADLFSDDLFEDEEGEGEGTVASNDVDSSGKRKYLDQDWQLNPEDEKEFEGFPSNQKAPSKASSDEITVAVPCYALMYRFRREYLDVSIDAMVADHKGHCDKFKRLINSEVIDMDKAKGAVLLWAGLTGDDKAETKSDIMTFMEEDPLIVKDVVEKWDLVDLEKAESNLPSLKTATA